MANDIVCGIDPSLNATGIVVLNSGRLEYHRVVECEIEDASNLKHQIERILNIENVVQTVLKDFKPQLIAMEGYAFGPSSSRAFSIGELGGVLKRAMYLNKSEFIMVPPRRVKMFLTGNGSADKSVMMTYVLKKYGVDFSESNHGHDLADAFAMAKIASYIYMMKYDHRSYENENLQSHERQIISKIISDGDNGE